MSIDRNRGVPFVPPVVDRLSVRVIVDSHYERFLPKAPHPVLAIDHVGEIPGRQMTTLAGEWGLSLHLESEGEGPKGQYLLDFGYTPEILNRNFDLLGIDAAKLDGLILSRREEMARVLSREGRLAIGQEPDRLRAVGVARAVSQSGGP